MMVNTLKKSSWVKAEARRTRTPDRHEILRRYFAQLELLSFRESHAASMQSCARLLDELPADPDPTVVQLVTKEKERLTRTAEVQRHRNAVAERVQDERFE